MSDEATRPGSGSGQEGARDAAALRASILARFQDLLDEALAQEDLPGGLDPALLAELTGTGETLERCDLHALWEAMTALSQEVKLQGRAFKQLAATLTPLVEQAAAPRAPESREPRLLELLLDLRDRLIRGLESARSCLDRPAHPPGWLARLLRTRRAGGEAGDAAAEALVQGCRLSLEHLDDQLAALGVTEIPCAGRPLDPHLMTVVEVRQTEDAPEGTVVQVHRAGYTHGGQVLRPAEVAVARALQPGPHGKET